MKKCFRKIVVNNKEYDWQYRKNYNISYVSIFDVYYELHYEYNILKYVEIRKKKFIKEFELNNITITTIQVRELILHGTLLSNQTIRKMKLKCIEKL